MSDVDAGRLVGVESLIRVRVETINLDNLPVAYRVRRDHDITTDGRPGAVFDDGNGRGIDRLADIRRENPLASVVGGKRLHECIHSGLTSSVIARSIMSEVNAALSASMNSASYSCA